MFLAIAVVEELRRAHEGLIFRVDLDLAFELLAWFLVDECDVAPLVKLMDIGVLVAFICRNLFDDIGRANRVVN